VISRLDLDFESPSQWAALQIKELWADAKVHVKPTPVRKAFLQYAADYVRSPGDKFKLLFGCQGGRANPYKGFSELEVALGLLSREMKSKIELHIFGECSDECLISGVRTKFHGEINDIEELSRLYKECDALAFPSLSETQGLVKDEALACGLKVIAFNRTACPEGIRHMQTGYIAEDVADFAKGLEWALGSA
jgi:glycosyltransferase involved in cell wall biosynthesis